MPLVETAWRVHLVLNVAAVGHHREREGALARLQRARTTATGRGRLATRRLFTAAAAALRSSWLAATTSDLHHVKGCG